MASTSPAFPRIVLSAAERASYDHSADTFLQQAATEYAHYRGYLDQSAWTHVRRAQAMDIYKSVYGVRDPQVTLMLGVGSLPGSVDDIMSGLYCDSTEDLRTVRTLLKHPIVDAGVFNASERASEAEPFRFAGIKWFAAKAAWGMAQTRDVLAYERMGRTRDALGRDLAFHVLYSIDRPEWPADGLMGLKRQHQISCFLYRQQDSKRVECFVWSTIYRLGSVSHRLEEFVAAGILLAVVNAPSCARARRLSMLMPSVQRPPWTGATGHLCCYACRGHSFLSNNVPCAGCAQFVCKSCSTKEKVFSVDPRSRRAQSRRFCRHCVDRTAASEHQTFERSVADKRRHKRRKKKGKSKSIDATMGTAPISSVVPPSQRHKSEVASDFSSARHWTSDSSESTSYTARSNSAFKYSDESDSDDYSGNEEELQPRGLTVADLIALSHEPVKSNRRNDRKSGWTNARGQPGRWNRAASGLRPLHAEHHGESSSEMAILEASHESDAADVDMFYQSPDGVDDPHQLHIMSGLSQFSLGIDIHGASHHDDSLDVDFEEDFDPNRTLQMPHSLRPRRGQPAAVMRREEEEDKAEFLSDLYSLSTSQVLHGPRREKTRCR